MKRALPLLSLSLLLCLTVLMGCNANKRIASPEEIAAAPLIPVTTPTLYRYGPQKGKITIHIKTTPSSDLGKSGIKPMNMVMRMDTDFKKSAKGLICEIVVPSMEINGTSMGNGLPIAVVKGQMTDRGTLIEYDVESPSMSAESNGAKKQEKLLQNVSGRLNNTFALLSENPIVSGDILSSMSMPNSVDPGNPIQTNEVLVGEKTVGGVTYVLTESEDTMDIPLEEGVLTLNIKTNRLFLKSSMAVIESNITAQTTIDGIEIVTITSTVHTELEQ